MKLDTQYIQPREEILVNRLVNWISIDEHCEKSKDDGFFADRDDTDDNDNESSSDDQGESRYPHGSQELEEDLAKYSLAADINPTNNKRELKEVNRKESILIGGFQVSLHALTSGKEFKRSGSISLHKKPPKVAFCPKEIKRILGLEVLQLKNAQSHTFRKIIVFASLGMRHGCEDMYELDFNHFTILLKGEPYISPENPGEHVLYENPGVRRKVFYPNRENPILCPVQVLEEEKAMRPSDASCPSCLFLCIKYGGRTRNLPQNEYVRQRMGINKLKSFGPIMCQMAMLVHIRSGRFFFKALGITLLFMAGFPDDLVQKETKYENLDLLQKYYRTDEDAKGEELFLSRPVACANVSPKSQPLTWKTIPAKSKGKKQTNPAAKLHNTQEASILKSTPPGAAPSTNFRLMGYYPIQTHPAAAVFQSIASQPPDNSPTLSNSVLSSAVHHHHISYCNQTLYNLFPPHPTNAFLPMIYQRPHNAFRPCPYPSLYGHQSFPYRGNFTASVHTQPYYTLPSCNPLVPSIAEGRENNDATLEEPDSESESSSSNTKPNEERVSSKHESG